MDRPTLIRRLQRAQRRTKALAQDIAAYNARRESRGQTPLDVELRVTERLTSELDSMLRTLSHEATA